MPILSRITSVGNRDFCAWIEDSGDIVTMTIDSEPMRRRKLHTWSKSEREAEASKLFNEWLEGYGISPVKSKEESLADELSRLSDLFKAGMLTESEFTQAKQKLLNP